MKKGKLLDSVVVFAPSEIVTGTAIKSVKKGRNYRLGVAGKISYFSLAEKNHQRLSNMPKKRGGRA